MSPESPGAPPRDLGRRFLLGSFYVGASSWATYVLNFAIQLGIARILGPADFGLYAFLVAVSELISIVAGFSFSLALIQARREAQELYDTAFVLSAAVGVAGLLVAAALAPWLWTTRSPEAAWYLVVIVLGRVGVIVSRVPNARLERSIRYGRVSVIAAVTGNLPNLLALGFAWMGLGALSLVLRDLLVGALAFALNMVWSGYRFLGRFRREAVRELMRFSRPMFFSRTIDVLLTWVDRLSIGTFFGNGPVGLYHQARFISEAGVVATRPVSQLSFNLYARVSTDPGRLARAYGLVNYFLIRVILAGALVLLLYPGETVRLLLGDEWTETAPLLQLLAPYAAILPFFENLRQLLLAVGRVGQHVRVRAAQLVVFGPAVLGACLAASLPGVALALLATASVGLVLLWMATRDLVGGATARLTLTPLLVCGAVVAGVAVLETQGVMDAVPWAVRPFLPALAYAAGLLAAERGRLFREIGYLRAQLRPAAPAAAAAAPAAGEEAT